VVVLIDLASSQVAPAEIVTQLKSAATPPVSVIAFGPHVHQTQLDAAKSAGCDLVLTRGQFDSQIAAILAGFAQSSGR
jgi:DNA-binding NarL/FixJ family response regulator